MNKRLRLVLLIFFSAILVTSLTVLGIYYIGGYIQQQRYDELSKLKVSVTPRPPVGEVAPESTTPPPALETVEDPKTGDPVSLLPEFGQLYTMNPDLVGWLTIPGTAIDYPVMQTPDSPDYYLTRNFDKESSSRGCLYAREVCDVAAPSDNITIYGHRMKDGTMLADLDLYLDADFFKKHPYIYFDTLLELRTYQVLAVFTTSAVEGKGFAYHMFVDAADEAEFHEFVTTCKSLARYDTGVDAAYGDTFITLSTCEYTQSHGRLVVVAKRVG